MELKQAVRAQVGDLAFTPSGGAPSLFSVSLGLVLDEATRNCFTGIHMEQEKPPEGGFSTWIARIIYRAVVVLMTFTDALD
jgi:hypothetical protein